MPERITLPVAVSPLISFVGSTLTEERTGFCTTNGAVEVTPSQTAEMVAVVSAVTATVVISKVTVFAPAGTVADPDTVAQEELLLRVTASPPVGAMADIVIVPTALTPPGTLEGFTVNPDIFGDTEIAADFVTPPLVAEILTAVTAVTLVAVIVNVPVLAPAAIVTLAGTVAAALELVKGTTAPPVGAVVDRVTVPVAVEPLMMSLALDTTDATVGAVISSVPFFEIPPDDAVIVAVTFAVEKVVVIVNVALVAP